MHIIYFHIKSIKGKEFKSVLKILLTVDLKGVFTLIELARETNEEVDMSSLMCTDAIPVVNFELKASYLFTGCAL